MDSTASSTAQHGTLIAGGSRPWATIGLVAANFLAFAAMADIGKRFADFDIQELLDCGGNFGPWTVHEQWWRLVSALFLHLDPVHLLVNMWVFWTAGRLAERLYGRWSLLFLYFTAGIVASLASVLWDPSRVSVGASGAIFGVLGALLIRLRDRRAGVPVGIGRLHWLSVLAFAAFSLISGALQTGIDNAAHVGGIAAGLALGWGLSRPFDARGRGPIAARQAAIALAAVAVAMTGLVLTVRGTGAELTASELYWRNHDWYLRGEHDDLRLWAELGQRGTAGTISDRELADRFESDIVPFWRMAESRLESEDSGLSGDQARFAALVLEFVQARRAWSEEIAQAAAVSDTSRVAQIQALANKADVISARIQRVQLRSGMSHRPRALSNSTLVAYVRDRLLAAPWQCVRAPASIALSPAATDSPTDGPALRDAIGCRAQRAFETDDFATLESLFAAHGQGLPDMPDGGSGLQGVIGGLGDLLRYGQVDWMREFGRTADWRHAYPRSVTPDLVEAMLFEEWAWAARGDGYANTVAPQALAIYNYRVEMAAEALRETTDAAAQCPLWYVLSLRVGVDQAIGLEKLRAIFDAGSAKFPDFLPLHSQMLRALMPRWYGSYRQVDQFISELDAKAQYRVGAELYTRLYWRYAALEGDYFNIFDTMDVQWSVMKAGFERLTKRYPTSDYLLNAFANFACAADDAPEYVNLRPRLDRRMSSTVWTDKVSLKSCDGKFAEALTSHATSGTQ